MKRKSLLIATAVCLLGLFSCAPLNSEEFNIGDLLGLFSCSPYTRNYTHEEIHEKIFSGVDLDEVTENLYLPTTLYNATISYESSDKDHLMTDGQVGREDFDRVEVTLTSYITIDEETKTFTDTVTILERYLTSSISEFYEYAVGEVIVTEGNIVDKLSNYFFIQDNTGYLTVIYNGNARNVYDYSKLEIGDYIRVIGSKGQNNDFYYLSVTDQTSILDSKYAIKEITDIDCVPELANNNIGRIYNLHDFTITSAYQKIRGTRDNYTVGLKDKNENEIKLFIFSAVKSQGSEIFKESKVGDKVTLNSVALCYQDGEYQFYFTESTSLFTDGLYLSSSQIKVDYNTPFEEAFSQVNVYLTESGVTRVLDRSELTVDSSKYKQDESAPYTITITYQEYTLTLTITVNADYATPEKETNAKGLQETIEQKGFTTGFASTGEINALVIPISFTNVDVNSNYPNYKSDLNKAFNGAASDTGWQSVKSYYETVSYGKITFNATILDAYNTGETYYTTGTLSNHYGDDYPEKEWITNALSYYDSQIDYSKYDSNSDGKIDTIYIVYLAPYLDDYNDMADLWWAYTNYFEVGDTYSKFDNMDVEFYIFASIEFLYDPFEDENSWYFQESTGINAETFIHETGHAFGLDDYYDYDDRSGKNAGSGGGLMMDYNVGDHDPFSKCLLGWADAYIATSDCKITLGSFEQTGDCIIIPKNWNGSYYTEYFIIDYYTPTGVNEKQAGYNGLIDGSGIRIFHVDASLNTNTGRDASYDCWSLTKYDNSYTSQVLLEFISARNSTTQSGAETTSQDLFKVGKTYNSTTFTSCKWHDGSKCNFSIEVVSITSEGANITITFN